MKHNLNPTKAVKMPGFCRVKTSQVNNLEAQAFCAWKAEVKGKPIRLISHQESFLMRQLAVDETSNSNLNRYASPSPVDMYHGYVNGVKVCNLFCIHSSVYCIDFLQSCFLKYTSIFFMWKSVLGLQ